MYTSIQDYAGAQRSGDTYGGQSTTEELGTLAKALEARSITGRETTDRLDASGAPLKAESLEKNLKVLMNYVSFFYIYSRKILLL